MLSKALEKGVCFHCGPFSGNVEGRSFPRAFEREIKISFYQENFYKELERHLKERSGNRQFSP